MSEEGRWEVAGDPVIRDREQQEFAIVLRGPSVGLPDDLVPASLLDSHKQRIEELEGALREIVAHTEFACWHDELCDEECAAMLVALAERALTTEQEKCERCGRDLK